MCIEEDFQSGELNGWYADSGAQNVVSEGDESYLAITLRTGTWAGPKISVPIDCIQKNTKYLISAKIRLVHPDGVSVSNCTSGILDRCPQLTMQFKETSSSSWEYSSVIDKTLVGSDWITMSTVLNFYREYPAIDTFFLTRLFFQGPGKDMIAEFQCSNVVL